MKHFIRFVTLFLKPHMGLFFFAILTGFIAAGSSGLGIPLMISSVFPILFNDVSTLPPWAQGLVGQIERPQLILLACLMIPFVFIIRGFAMWFNAVIVNMLTIRVLRDLRVSFFHRLQRIPLAYLERQRKGDLISRLMTDTQNVQTLITNVSNDIIKQPITSICSLVAFFYILLSKGVDWTFVMNLFFVFLAIYPIILFGKRISARSKQAQKELGKLSAHLQQNLETQREVRAYAMETKQIESFASISGEFRRNSLKLIKYQKALIPVMETVTALALSFLLVRGKLGGMQLEDFLALAAALFMCFDSMKRAGRAFNRFSEAQASLLRLTEIWDVQESIFDPAEPKSIEGVRGDIEFRNLQFSYTPEHPILRDINVHIPAGQIVGLVGASGAGKTTFASLIPRFYEASEGQVLIDGIDVKDVRQHDLRDKIALVSQHALLFAGSIAENIALGREGCSDEEVKEAALLAQVEAFLDGKSQGIDTILGEGGSGLSGGQRQRVAIARAFVRNAPILILDEATASLDAESEKSIQHSLEELSAGRTTLIVAHRFSTIRHAQRILVFDKGLIVGDGSHEQLYGNCPIYTELYDRQGVN